MIVAEKKAVVHYEKPDFGAYFDSKNPGWSEKLFRYIYYKYPCSFKRLYLSKKLSDLSYAIEIFDTAKDRYFKFYNTGAIENAGDGKKLLQKINDTEELAWRDTFDYIDRYFNDVKNIGNQEFKDNNWSKNYLDNNDDYTYPEMIPFFNPFVPDYLASSKKDTSVPFNKKLPEEVKNRVIYDRENFPYFHMVDPSISEKIFKHLYYNHACCFKRMTYENTLGRYLGRYVDLYDKMYKIALEEAKELPISIDWENVENNAWKEVFAHIDAFYSNEKSVPIYKDKMGLTINEIETNKFYKKEFEKNRDPLENESKGIEFDKIIYKYPDIPPFIFNPDYSSNGDFGYGYDYNGYDR